MKSASDRPSVTSAAFGSLMDPEFLRQAVDDDSAAFASVRRQAGPHASGWLHLRTRLKAFGSWAFHRTVH